MIELLDLIAEAKLPSPPPSPGDFAPGAPASCITRLRHTHHMLARVLAEGKSNVEAAALTGYSPGRVADMRKDPAFQELLAYYQVQVDDLFAKLQDRIGALGVSFLDEIQHRLETAPESFSLEQLRKMTETLLDRSVAPAKGGSKGPAGTAPSAISVKIDFGGRAEPGASPVLELEAN